MDLKKSIIIPLVKKMTGGYGGYKGEMKRKVTGWNKVKGSTKSPSAK